MKRAAETEEGRALPEDFLSGILLSPSPKIRKTEEKTLVASLAPPPGSDPSDLKIQLLEGSLTVGRGVGLPLDDRLSRKHVEFWVSLEGPVILASRLGFHKVFLTRHLHLTAELLEIGKPTIVREHDVLQFLEEGTPYKLKYERDFQPLVTGSLQYSRPKQKARTAEAQVQTEATKVTLDQAQKVLSKVVAKAKDIISECALDPADSEQGKIPF